MKTSIIVLLAFVIVPSVLPQTKQFPAEKKSDIVDNLTVGINSANTGVRVGSANVLYDLIDESYLQSQDATKSMIPLLKMLENGKTDDERIAAAVSLFKLGNSIGIYRLRGVAIYDDNERVNTICKNLYYTYHKLNGTEYLVNFQ